jgi:hypothetical protein
VVNRIRHSVAKFAKYAAKTKKKDTDNVAQIRCKFTNVEFSKSMLPNRQFTAGRE